MYVACLVSSYSKAENKTVCWIVLLVTYSGPTGDPTVQNLGGGCLVVVVVVVVVVGSLE
jgi:hypothetical protein